MDWRTTMRTYVLFLKNCQKTICMHGYSPIHVDRSLRVSNLEDKSLRRKRTFPRGLENDHACKWILDNFPGIICMSAFLESCQKSICLHGCSRIHVEGSDHCWNLIEPGSKSATFATTKKHKHFFWFPLKDIKIEDIFF